MEKNTILNIKWSISIKKIIVNVLYSLHLSRSQCRLRFSSIHFHFLFKYMYINVDFYVLFSPFSRNEIIITKYYNFFNNIIKSVLIQMRTLILLYFNDFAKYLKFPELEKVCWTEIYCSLKDFTLKRHAKSNLSFNFLINIF